MFSFLRIYKYDYLKFKVYDNGRVFWTKNIGIYWFLPGDKNNSSVNFLPGIARSAVILQFGGPLLAKMAFIPLSGVPVSWSAHQQYLWHCTILNLPSGVHCGIYIPPFGSTDCWLREDACSSKQLFLMTINYIFYLIYIVINKSFHIWKVIDDKKQSQFFFYFFWRLKHVTSFLRLDRKPLR